MDLTKPVRNTANDYIIGMAGNSTSTMMRAEEREERWGPGQTAG